MDIISCDLFPRYLDTCYVDVDVQPYYARVTIKGKVLQLTLPGEVSVTDSTARRNTTNGTLVVTMPRLNPLPTIAPRDNRQLAERKRDCPTTERRSATNVREYLEIGPAADDLDFSRIVRRPTEPGKILAVSPDDYSTQVPPLE